MSTRGGGGVRREGPVPAAVPPGVYELDAHGRVRTHSLEVHVTDHCNLRCAQCCALAPYLPPRFVTREAFARDLALARAALAPAYFKLAGGEPLLHPDLVALIECAKASAIAPVVSLTTNGVLLERAPDALWAALDALTLSVYPGVLSAQRLASIERKAARFDVALNVKRQDEFEDMTLPRARAPDDPATRAVFAGCWLRHRCHVVRDGVFFVCNKPGDLDAMHRGATDYAARDGLALHSDTARLRRELLAYLRASEPLAACRVCYGGTGARHPYRQLTRAEVGARRLAVVAE